MFSAAPPGPTVRPDARAVPVPQQPENGDSRDADFSHVGRGHRVRRTRLRILVAVIEAALLGALISVLVTGQTRIAPPTAGDTPPPPGRPTPSPSPPRASFAFTDVRVTSVAVGSTRARRAVRDAGDEVATQLTTFYDLALLAPETWAGALPPAAWRVFASTARAHAMEDAASMTLVGAAGLESVEVRMARVAVHVLLAESGRPEAALARVSVRATGRTEDGQELRITSDASFLLRPSRGAWRIVGYPNAETVVEAAPDPSPSPPPVSPSPSPGSPSPSPGSPSPPGAQP